MKLTEWFPVGVNPAHPGMYEVNLTAWPWPLLIKWSTRSGWKKYTAYVTQWRGVVDKT